MVHFTRLDSTRIRFGPVDDVLGLMILCRCGERVSEWGWRAEIDGGLGKGREWEECGGN